MTWIWIIPALVFFLTLRRPVLGVASVIVILPSYLLRTVVGGIPTTVLELSIYASTAAVAALVLSRRLTWAWVRMSRTTWWLLAGWIVAWVLATALADDRTAALGALKAWLADPLLAAALLAVTVRTPHDRLQILRALFISGTAVALAGLYQLAFARETLQEGRLSSWYAPVANYAAMYLGPILVLNIGVLLHHARTAWYAASAGVMTIALALTLSFGGYLAVAAGTIFLWWMLPHGRLKRRLLVGGIVAAVISVLVIVQTPNFRQHFDFSGRSSGSARMQIWVTSWALIRQDPWFGVGPNNFEPAYREELPKHYFPPLEWLVAQPHNLYLALWLETGLLGLAAFLALFVYHVHRAGRDFFSASRHRAAAIVSLAGLITILVHGLVDTTYFKNDLSVLFLAIALLPWLDRSRESADQN